MKIYLYGKVNNLKVWVKWRMRQRGYTIKHRYTNAKQYYADFILKVCLIGKQEFNKIDGFGGFVFEILGYHTGGKDLLPCLKYFFKKSLLKIMQTLYSNNFK